MPSLGLNTEGFAFPVLVGDIGGTNARFRVVDETDGSDEVWIVPVVDFPNVDSAILFVLAKREGPRPRSAVLTVAGPVEGNVIPYTNNHWRIAPDALKTRLGLEDLVLLNDFEAQALAVVALGPEHMETIGVPREPEPEAGRVVLGPGTGLGVAGLIHSRGRWIPIPGEGGHMDIGPRTPRDREVFPHLEPIEGRISGEQILCGRGLVNLYRAVAKASGADAPLKLPAQVTAAGLSGSDPVAAETVELFATYLGRTAGDLALVFKSLGGVFLSGGIAQKIAPALHGPAFRQAFEDKAPHRLMMQAMPVYVITHPLAAVIGLAAYVRDPERFGIETAGRRWRG